MNNHTKTTKEKTPNFEHFLIFPEEMQKEVRENSENILKIYNRVKEILEYDFEGIYSYFNDILEKQYNFVVLMSRRCLVLFQLFIYFYIFDNKKIPCKSVLLSDKAIPYYFKQFKENNRIAVVDDIIVHGRTVCSIYEIIKEVCSNVDIDFYGYASDQDLDCLLKEVSKKLNVSYVASTREWRKLSNNIVSSILVSNIPYTSFVTAFFQYDDASKWSFLENNNDFRLIRNSENIQTDVGIDSYCLYEKNWNKPEIISLLSLGECIRIYWNAYTKKLTVIPYVFIRSLTADDAEKAIEYVCDLLPDEYSNIKSLLNTKITTPICRKALEEYKMRILTCYLSGYYWRSFLERYSLPEPQYVDVDTLIKSFGEPIAVELGSIKADHLESVINYSLGTNYKSISLFDCHIAENKFDKWLPKHFYSAWAEDEQRAKKNKPRARGYTIDSLLLQGKKFGLDNDEILSKLVNNWDIGIAAANFSFDPLTNDIGCYVTPGEQSYKILLENNASIMYALITVSNMVTKGDAKKHNLTFEQYRVALLKELLGRYNSSGQLPDYKDIETIIENTQGYLNAWDQPIVWKNTMSEENKIIMSDFIKEKF